MHVSKRKIGRVSKRAAASSKIDSSISVKPVCRMPTRPTALKPALLLLSDPMLFGAFLSGLSEAGSNYRWLTIRVGVK